MKNNRNINALNLILLTILSLTFFGDIAQAQSTDIDNPTVLTSNIIEGEHEGESEALYYSFTATKGDVKITFDGKTKYYTGWVKVELLNEDGSIELFSLNGEATSTSKRTAGTKRFLRGQKVILRVSIEKDGLVGLINYKIRLDGAVQFEAPPATEETPKPTTEETPSQPAESPAKPSEQTEETPSTESKTPAETKPSPAKNATIEKVKKKAKKKAKKVFDSILDD